MWGSNTVRCHKNGNSYNGFAGSCLQNLFKITTQFEAGF